MIGTSIPAYLFIRGCIFFLTWIAPLSILYCITIYLIHPATFHLSWILEAFVTIETAFYLLIYFPRKHYLQRAATHPKPGPREQRRILFDRCHENIPDPDRYLSKWFMDSPASEIKRENVKEFFRWGFLNTGDVDTADDKELEGYIDELEESIGRKFEPGRGNAKCLRLTLDKVTMLHRSVTWYLCVFVVDSIASAYLRFYSFTYHKSPLKRFFSVFPFRPFHQLSAYNSPAKILTYWHRPHTAKNRLPILFIHGIGIGLYPYVNFLSEINGKNETDGSDGELGIIALEIMPVSFRITGEAMQKDEMCREIKAILDAHGWDKFVLVSHSYGSVIATHLLHTPALKPRIGPILFIDPVSFLLHLPDVAYNFIVRVPKRANEHQLYYFASKDMGVSHTLSRRFFWSENILWKEDIAGRRVTVSLGGKDLIVDTGVLRRYLLEGNLSRRSKEQPKNLANGSNGHATANGNGNGHAYGNTNGNAYKTMEKTMPNGSNQPLTGAGLEVKWYPNLDHAQVFDTKATRAQLVRVIRLYCAVGFIDALPEE